MSSDRRSFLKRAGLSAAALTAAPAIANAERSDTSRSEQDRYTRLELGSFRRGANGELQSLAMQPPSPWDLTWPEKITGKYRAMFDIDEVADGIGVFRAGMWAAQYRTGFGASEADLSKVLVLRHNAVPLLMSQDFWTSYNVGEAFNIKSEDGSIIKHNPVLPLPDAAANSNGNPFTIDVLMEQGALVLGCGLAFSDITAFVAEHDKICSPVAYTKATTMLVQGVILQPSGIFANVLAQEHGCAFVNAV